MITILDYGLGNLAAIENVYKSENIPVVRATKESELIGAERIIVPGVGSFDAAMTMLNESGMRVELENAALRRKIPILGICVGMQMLANSSEEGKLQGLGWIDGQVRKLPSVAGSAQKLILPHMGWNTISAREESPLLSRVSDDSRFYFVHSYYFECKYSENSLAQTDYGISFSSAVFKENIFGVQFHPEKSHSSGRKLLLNFAELAPCSGQE